MMRTTGDVASGNPDTGLERRSPFSLDEKYTREEGLIFLSGIQALVRLPLDQHRADRRRGLRTATAICGYRGSPLGGLDLAIERSGELLRRHDVVFVPGVNEDLAATVVWGSQFAHTHPSPRYDGVVGMWYGKGPGVDRSGDALKHANYAGVGPNGGVLAVGGDDPKCKSSTLPSHSEVAFYDALMPVVHPGSIQEVLDFGRLGFELSRYSGLWVGFKIVTDVADGLGTAEVGRDRITISDPGFTFEGRRWKHTQNRMLIAPWSLELEREIFHGRLEAAKAFAAANGLNRITVPTVEAWIGIVASGKTYYDLRQALGDLGLDDDDLRRYGIRLLRVGMPFPMEPSIIRKFARGLEEILIIEEKRSFVELFIRDILYNQAERPRIVGKHDEDARVLVPPEGELDADRIARIVSSRLTRRIPREALAGRVVALDSIAGRSLPVVPLARAPFYCSGCPHNRSTQVPEGSMSAAGIGCHGMALLHSPDTHEGITHMGGEGAQWVGAAPFTETAHIFQNLGDGTLFHSGSLAIRQAVAAGTRITYKILYNSAVAMTGGQDAAGATPVPELTRALEAEGVRRIIVVSDEPDKYSRRARWGAGVEVWHRDRLDEAQRILREIPGVTVLIYDQRCAAEKRRLRKRGKLPDPKMRVVINELLCEGCGDCGEKSNCLSVQPVDTEFGRKTQVHQASCNKDYSCLEGDCPSFLTVIPLEGRGRKGLPRITLDRDLPDAARKVPLTCNVLLTGIGGTGVVTVSQVLATAAFLEGRYVVGLDQTGLSQKAGPVVSHLRLLEEPAEVANRVGAGEADCHLGLDLLVASAVQNLERASPSRTIAVVSTSRVPTGSMVRSTGVEFPDVAGLTRQIDRVTRRKDNAYLDSVSLAESLFGDHLAANMIMLGAAYQAGAVPVHASAIEQAIALNDVAVETNTTAFRAGRLAVVDPGWATAALRRTGAIEIDAQRSPEAVALIEATGAGGELRRLLEIRVPELIEYQDLRYARGYVEFVTRVRRAEDTAVPGETRLSEAVARYLFKLMAYKDEYEVPRLHLKAEAVRALAEQFPDGMKLRYNLHPPLLRALGWKRKIRFGKWIRPVFRILTAMRRLRGTPFDPFGHTKVRRVERSLIETYRGLVEVALGDLSPETHDRAVSLATLPDVIRGYEEIKLHNVRRFWNEVRNLGFPVPARWEGPS